MSFCIIVCQCTTHISRQVDTPYHLALSVKKEPPTVLDATEVQFVPDPVEIQPQQVVAAFTGKDINCSDALVSTIITAVWTAIQSTSAVQPPNVVEAAIHDDVS